MHRFVLLQLLRGYCMGAADIVPGVSGGTIALIVGIYERLVAAVHDGARILASAARWRWSEVVDRLRRFDWVFILPLLGGIAVAFVSLATLIDHLLDEEPVPTVAFFFGLVVASVVVAARLIRDPRPGHLLLALAVGAAAFGLLGLRSDATDDPTLPFVFVSGMVAICAMILPGISGSFILLMLGVYDAMLEAVRHRELLNVVVFLGGAILGLALFSSLLDWMLRRYHDAVLAALVGLMAGSLRVIWPWPEGAEATALEAPPAGDVPIAIACAVGGAALVLALSALGSGRVRRPRHHGEGTASTPLPERDG